MNLFSKFITVSNLPVVCILTVVLLACVASQRSARHWLTAAPWHIHTVNNVGVASAMMALRRPRQLFCFRCMQAKMAQYIISIKPALSKATCHLDDCYT